MVDEGHRIKNATCKLATTLAVFKADGRLLLTGAAQILDLTEPQCMSSQIKSACHPRETRARNPQYKSRPSDSQSVPLLTAADNNPGSVLQQAPTSALIEYHHC